MLAGGSPFIGLGNKFAGGKFAGSLFNLPSISSALNLSGEKKGTGAAMDALKVGTAGGVITGLIDSLTRQEGETDQDFMNRTAEVKDQLKVQFSRLYPQEGNESEEDYDIRIDAMVANAQGEQGSFSEGGRVNRAMGSDDKVEMASQRIRIYCRRS